MNKNFSHRDSLWGVNLHQHVLLLNIAVSLLCFSTPGLQGGYLGYLNSACNSRCSKDTVRIVYVFKASLSEGNFGVY
jgi:hypothetical protein